MSYTDPPVGDDFPKRETTSLGLRMAVLRCQAFLFMPELLTPTEVAAILKVSTDSVLRRFANVPGVIDLGTEETRRKRRYRILRIPKTVLERFLIENRIQ